jgi:hypothetical protein
MNNNIDMETIIVKKSRNYFRRFALIVLLILILCILVVFLRNPSEHTYFLLPTKNLVILFSLVGILICMLVLYIVLKNFFRKNVVLKIDEQGIFNGFSLYNNKLIKWEEISKIETVRHNHNNYIAIFLKKIINNEKGINSFLFMINEKSMGTPHIISSGDLDCSFKELEKLIFEAYEASKAR